jgi:hypothetical protein
MISFSVDSPLHRLDCTCSTTNNEHLLAFGVLAIKPGRVEDVSMELLLVRQVRYFRVTTSSHRGDDTIKSAIARVVDDPAVLLVL